MSLIRRVVTVAFALVVLLVGVLFSSHNSQKVVLDFLIYKTPEFYLSFWIIVSFALGGLIGVLASSATIVRLRAGQKRSNKKMKHSEGELVRLKGESA
jgi:lipopolysaccharide assembly protein A